MYLLQYNIYNLFYLHVSTLLSHLQALIFKNYWHILCYSILILTRTIAIGIPLCITESELMSISCWGWGGGCGSCFGVNPSPSNLQTLVSVMHKGMTIAVVRVRLKIL